MSNSDDSQSKSTSIPLGATYLMMVVAVLIIPIVTRDVIDDLNGNAATYLEKARPKDCEMGLLSAVSMGAEVTQGTLVLSSDSSARLQRRIARTMCSRDVGVTFSGQSSISKVHGVLSE